jgi:hypothetical protein
MAGKIKCIQDLLSLEELIKMPNYLRKIHNMKYQRQTTQPSPFSISQTSS